MAEAVAENEPWAEAALVGAPAETATWLRSALKPSAEARTWLLRFSRVARRLGAASGSGHAPGPLRPLVDGLPAEQAGCLKALTARDLGRTAILRAAERSLGAGFVPWLRRLLAQGDESEAASCYRALFWLHRPEAVLDVAIEACRTNIVDVLAAIACDNPYPEAHFPDLHFNQMVLKAIFLGIGTSRVVGLERRHNSELARMAADFAAERRAAGRTIPEDALRLAS